MTLLFAFAPNGVKVFPKTGIRALVSPKAGELVTKRRDLKALVATGCALCHPRSAARLGLGAGTPCPGNKVFGREQRPRPVAPKKPTWPSAPTMCFLSSLECPLWPWRRGPQPRHSPSEAPPSVCLFLLSRTNVFCLQCTRQKERGFSADEWINPSILICFRAKLAANSHRRGHWQTQF